jgi:hypothetical protein
MELPLDSTMATKSFFSLLTTEFTLINTGAAVVVSGITYINYRNQQKLTRFQVQWELIKEYGEENLMEAVSALTCYCQKRLDEQDTDFAKTWALAKKQHQLEAQGLDKHRRRLIFWYSKLMLLKEQGLINEEFLKWFPGKSHAHTFLKCVEPMEQANCKTILGRQWDEEHKPQVFDKLRKAFGIPLGHQ